MSSNAIIEHNVRVSDIGNSNTEVEFPISRRYHTFELGYD